MAISKMRSGINLKDENEEESRLRQSKETMLESEIDYLQILRQKAPIDVQRAFAESMLMSKIIPLENEIRSKRDYGSKTSLGEDEVKQRKGELWRLRTFIRELERETSLAGSP